PNRRLVSLPPPCARRLRRKAERQSVARSRRNRDIRASAHCVGKFPPPKQIQSSKHPRHTLCRAGGKSCPTRRPSARDTAESDFETRGAAYLGDYSLTKSPLLKASPAPSVDLTRRS